MKKISFWGIVALLIAGVACNRIAEPTLSGIDSPDMNDPKVDFVSILSKAVTSDEELRSFIKTEAQSMFDRDYDVFYPFVKDKIVHDGMTFRDILLHYCDDKARFERIESSLPLLNILVPDWAWLGCFSINNWDTSDGNIAVGYSDSNMNRVVYADGKRLGELESDDFPVFPIILVKNNERMKVTAPATKGSDATYDFVHPVFNGSGEVMTKVEHQYYDRYLGNEAADNFMPAKDLDPLVINAYNVFRNNNSAAHRDHIYYGLTNTKTSGTRDTHVREILHKIKLSTLNCSYLFDGESGSGDFNEHYGEVEKKKTDFTDDELKNMIWIDGQLELQLSFASASSDGTVQVYPIVIPAGFGDLFVLDKTNVDYRHKTWFCKDWWVHKVDGRDHFIPKWFVIDQNIGYMDIATKSSTTYIVAHELDSERDTQYEITYKSTYMTNFEANGEISGGLGSMINAKVGLGYGNTSTEEKETKVTVNIKEGSDYLGAAPLNYMDPIIRSAATKNGVAGYYINTLKTYYLEMMILPTRI